jgi:hypothetical protein
MDVRDDRDMAAALTETFHDMLEIPRVFHCRRGDAHNFAAYLRQLHRLLGRRFGVHRVTGDHGLDTDRILPADPNVADLYFTS